jgi:hypothetical protein
VRVQQHTSQDRNAPEAQPGEGGMLLLQRHLALPPQLPLSAGSATRSHAARALAQQHRSVELSHQCAQ